jgi:hypothetical protein
MTNHGVRDAIFYQRPEINSGIALACNVIGQLPTNEQDYAEELETFAVLHSKSQLPVPVAARLKKFCPSFNLVEMR